MVCCLLFLENGDAVDTVWPVAPYDLDLLKLLFLYGRIRQTASQELGLLKGDLISRFGSQSRHVAPAPFCI